MKEVVIQHLEEARCGLDELLRNELMLDAISEAGLLIASRLRNGGKVMSCGNGGSMCDAMHFAEELSGRYRQDRPSFAAVSISDPSHLTCVGNDYGFEEVFARYVDGVGRPGDVLVGFSTSGSSKNVIRAAEQANSRGISVICLTGKSNSALAELSDIEICTPAGQFADRVQELHIKVVHILIDLIERHLEQGTK